jgi:NAD(P)-dependent dehydrogenase (short-subunit alcohol dehydrogenase family)
MRDAQIGQEIGMDMAGKVALVTGAGGGIGRATAELFARQGAQVLVSDIQADAVEATAAAIRAAGGEASAFSCDVSTREGAADIVQAAQKAFGRLDYAFNNAGVNYAADAEWDFDLFERTMKINAAGVFYGMKAQIGAMLAQGGEGYAIVNTASINGLVASPQAGYVASKHAVIGLSKSAAVKYARQGVRVNAVCPGVIDTPMAQAAASDPNVKAMIEAMTPMGRWGRAEEIAEAVVWLSSPKASFVTAQALAVDGGVVAV